MKKFHIWIIWLICFISLNLAACTSEPPTPQPFTYQVTIRDKETTAFLSNVKVMIILRGQLTPITDFTDDNGLAVFEIDASMIGKIADIVVEAPNYKPRNITTNLNQEQLPPDIRLDLQEAISGITPTVTPAKPNPKDTPEPSATATTTVDTPTAEVELTSTNTPSPTPVPPTHTPTPTPTATREVEIDLQQTDEVPTGQVVGAGINIYTMPAIPEGAGYRIGGVLGFVDDDNPFDIVEQSGDSMWFRIEEVSGRRGWVQATNVILSDDVLLVNVPFSEQYPETIDLSTVSGGDTGGSSEPSSSCGMAIVKELTLTALIVRWSGVANDVNHLVLSVVSDENSQQILFPSNIDRSQIEANNGFSVTYNLGNRQIEQGKSYTITLQAADASNNILCTATDSFVRPQP